MATSEKNWWAQGDTPVRSGTRVTYLVDGRAAMLAMCRHFVKARSYIYLANWGLTATMSLVRGPDCCDGPATAAQREALIGELRAEGLTDADIAFWLDGDLSLQAVLGYAVRKGVEVKVLPWKSSEFFSHYSPEEVHERLTAVGVTCLLDDSSQGILHHPIESLHQKISVVDGRYAFVGGVDLLIEKGGEFDRWDRTDHPYETPLRRTVTGGSPHPWHDAHALIVGPAAADVELNFRERWNDLVRHHHYPEHLLITERPLPEPVQSPGLVQVARTIPEHTYSFKPLIIRGIAQLYAHAFQNIERFVYLENQYLWLRAYYGVDMPLMGNESPEMVQNMQFLVEALRRGVAMSIILPDHPNVGRAFSDAGLQHLRESAPQAMEEGRLQAFCLATSVTKEGREHYRPIYVHAKVAIVDDVWSTVGSGNLNNRGMRDDTEMNVATLDPERTHGLRLMLQGEHLGLLSNDDLFVVSRFLGQQVQHAQDQARALQALHYLEETLGDPLTALRLMHERAWANLRRYQANQPLIGHLLPYITEDEAAQLGLPFNEGHGWIEEPSQER